jgi:hypothetical protein
MALDSAEDQTDVEDDDASEDQVHDVEPTDAEAIDSDIEEIPEFYATTDFNDAEAEESDDSTSDDDEPVRAPRRAAATNASKEIVPRFEAIRRSSRLHQTGKRALGQEILNIAARYEAKGTQWVGKKDNELGDILKWPDGGWYRLIPDSRGTIVEYARGRFFDEDTGDKMRFAPLPEMPPGSKDHYWKRDKGIPVLVENFSDDSDEEDEEE